ncbi:hypothetical protein IV203_032315 [Nitzschia inconspicua]|uniref:Uncharacterized protein n=1 Tax=Nitzschia inconspicua TaxID=303405 RepID=A0A9K3KKJ5_9STRA|nr:hypothetical protein IV203_032315 [Nitzschia inconspicua]
MNRNCDNQDLYQRPVSSDKNEEQRLDVEPRLLVTPKPSPSSRKSSDLSFMKPSRATKKIKLLSPPPLLLPTFKTASEPLIIFDSLNHSIDSDLSLPLLDHEEDIHHVFYLPQRKTTNTNIIDAYRSEMKQHCSIPDPMLPDQQTEIGADVVRLRKRTVSYDEPHLAFQQPQRFKGQHDEYLNSH